ncbi:hypothetical protein M3Y99_00351500 [Aphelenchoides fujianensis]|nr:hypothetical protein M3Y99_00351500 [Aphelenchoides fujianensis]
MQVLIPSMKLKTERVLFKGPSEKKVQINGEHCMDKMWVFKVWQKNKKGRWVGATKSMAKLGGTGYIRVIVDDSLKPIANDRMGIACSEGSHLRIDRLLAF